MLTIAAFVFGVLGIAAAENAGEHMKAGPAFPRTPVEAKVGRFLAVLFIALAIACAVSGASH